MNILVVTPESPWPPTHGAAVRNSHFIRALARRHTVDVVSVAPPSDSSGQIDGLRRTRFVPGVTRRPSRRWLQALLGRAPSLVARHASHALRVAVQQELLREPYDAVHIEGLQLAPLVHDVGATFAGAGPRPFVVYDAHNLEWRLQRDLARNATGWRRRYATRQAALLRTVERWVVEHADVSIASSEADRQGLELLGGRRVRLVPHPVEVPARRPGKRTLARTARVLFAANFAYRPNRLSAGWMFGSVWPAVVRRMPDAELRVIGPASEQLRGLVPIRAGIHGVVDDIWPEYAAAWLAVSPAAVGSGAPYKVLHAYAAGRAAVVRRAGLAGLADGAMSGLIAADTAAEFATAIVDLLRDPERRDTAGAAGFAYVRATHAVDIVGDGLCEIYAELAQSRARGVDG